MLRPVVTLDKAVCYSVISVFGIIFLGAMGYFFSIPAESLTHGAKSPENPAAVAHACFTATAFYTFLFLFCGCQTLLHRRQSRSEIHLQ